MVRCKLEGCGFFICVRGCKKADGLVVRQFIGEHNHSAGDQCQMGQWGKSKVRVKLVSQLIEGKVHKSYDYLLTDIMKELELKVRMSLTYMQVCRAREYVQLLVTPPKY